MCYKVFLLMIIEKIIYNYVVLPMLYPFARCSVTVERGAKKILTSIMPDHLCTFVLSSAGCSPCRSTVAW